ncbi:hypothetical protein JST56_07070 [Candidatus Dependentiae bacterium]|nr:hypothetical protein [Candidatus Dependentiae bacterium]
MNNNKGVKSPTFLATAYASMVFLLYLLMYLIFSSCNTSKRAERLIDKGARISPITIAKECAARFPTKDSIHESVVYKQGQTITKKETEYVTINCDSMVNLAKSDKSVNTKYVKTPCPPCDSLRIDTLEKLLFVGKELTANLEVAKAEYKELEAKYNKSQEDSIGFLKEKNKWMQAALWTWAIVGIYLLVRFLWARFGGKFIDWVK